MALWASISGGCFAGVALGASLTWAAGRGADKKQAQTAELSRSTDNENGSGEKSPPKRERPRSILVNGKKSSRPARLSVCLLDESQMREEAKILPASPKKPDTDNGAASPSTKARKLQRRASSRFAMNENKVIVQKLVIVMVGLPARGKSFISKALVRYLNFLGCPTKIFNAGNSRRHVGKAGIGANFFDSSNAEAKQIREQLAMECLDDLLTFLKEETHSTAVGILDATNTTQERRKRVLDRCKQEPGIRLIFLESICNDPEILKNNYDLKLENEDYQGMDADAALNDFRDRVRKYKDVYEELEEEECAQVVGHSSGFIKLINAGETMTCHKCRTKEDEYGVVRHITGLLQNVHLGRRSIVLAQIGETENDRAGLLGGDSSLTDLGFEHADALANLVTHLEQRDKKNCYIICGTLARHLQTAEALKVAAATEGMPKRLRTVLKLNRLNELCAGALDGYSYKALQEEYPEEFEARRQDKLNYRYPGVGGESYQDLVMRLLEIILRIEGLQSHVVVLCDKAVCRVFLSYFRGIDMSKMPYSPVPSGVVIFERSHTGYAEEILDMKGMHPALGSGDMIEQLGRLAS